MRRDFTIAVVVWIIVTALSLYGAMIMNPFPTEAAKEAEFVDHAFRAMTYMAAPVFGLVMAGLIVAVTRFRTSGPDTGDGAPIRGTNAVPKLWFGITSALAVVVMIYPGLTGLAELRKDKTADLEINVTGGRWAWQVNYPAQKVSIAGSQEMVLPKDERVKFNVTAFQGDVLHSFWIPAFRVKVDAVPGQTTHVYLTPTETGSKADDPAFRIQCAELCGLQHATMTMPVRVVERAEFDRWVAEKAVK